MRQPPFRRSFQLLCGMCIIPLAYKSPVRLVARPDLLDVLLTPVIHRNRKTFVFDWFLPFIPEVDRAAIRFVYWLIDPDSAWQQARIANN